MIALWSIAKNAFVQTIRTPIYGFLLLVTFLMLTVVNLPLAGWTMGADYTATDQRMLESAGLGTLLAAGMFAAAFCASAAIRRDIEEHTVLTILAKPVSRGVFVLGKYAGLAAAVTIFYYLASLVFLLTIRHKVVSNAATPIHWPVIVLGLSALGTAVLAAGAGNYMFGWTFVSTVVIGLLLTLTAALAAVCMMGHDWTITPLSDAFGPDQIRPPLLRGLLLIYLAVLTLTATAVAASVRLGLVPTLLLCAAVLFLGSMMPWLSRRLSETLPEAEPILWLLPNFTLFYPLDALAADREIPASALLEGGRYFLCYSAGILTLGIALFHSRSLEERAGGSALPGAAALLSGLGRLAAVVAGIIAAALLLRPASYTFRGLLQIGGLMAAALGGWMLFYLFGRGRPAAYGILLALTVAALLRGAAIWFFPEAAGFLRWGEPRSQTPLVAGLAASVLLVLLLPKTRRHFRSS